MKKALLSVFSVLVLAAVVIGCATTKTQASAQENKIKKWQDNRTPVEVLKSKISLKAAGAIVEALDVAPFGIYKSIADKVDSAATKDEYRKLALGLEGDIQGLKEQGKSEEEAIKIVIAEVKKMEDGEEKLANLKKYYDEVSKTNYDVVFAWIKTVAEEIVKAGQEFSQESPKAMQQILDLAKAEGGMAAITIPKQAKADLGVIGDQLSDSKEGLALYKEMMERDKKIANMPSQIFTSEN